ncbi:CAF17-like 4Fe-4S cluster assembly/insertion protein YgfZ [Bordetella hinzii]|uniref:Folate-binding protein n=3 Tax=Bordetella hinzii TaxID=103855 RepID=A0AAN1RYV8_9BORD|nr:folate-binding protein YgfZ [Bordetella hinzii]AKQ55922.1 tRNA-modifying protein YgfZ [Bordetella hinzii]AKQ60454.1 tRNA-modifying protein YgfZ [Bordetella hinzii]AZW18498.1 folate-binding protein [Bordetella hinzii]KCB28522.1 glycine cleavage T-protein [Bordetella hinzii L60]KCB47280.1 glycine cleavage T-protein [Bordetella hinzii 4161]
MHPLTDSIISRPEGSPRFAPLSGLRVLTAAGPDALGFLHGQLTQDVNGLPPEGARLAGYCTAKGRLLATLVMWRAGAESVEALVRADLAEALVKRLSMFVLRAKVKIGLADRAVAGVTASPAQLDALSQAAGGALPTTAWTRADLPSGTWIAAPGASLRWWWVADAAQIHGHGAALAALLGKDDEDSWRAADLAAGLPWIAAATQDLFIPQTVNLELIGGVSFTKGCYPGQEVVARSHYRGTVKRRMAYGTAALPVPAPGLDVYDAADPGEPVGRVIDAARAGDAASLLFETTLAALPAGQLRLGAPDGPAITLAELPYAIQE